MYHVSTDLFWFSGFLWPVKIRTIFSGFLKSVIPDICASVHRSRTSLISWLFIFQHQGIIEQSQNVLILKSLRRSCILSLLSTDKSDELGLRAFFYLVDATAQLRISYLLTPYCINSKLKIHASLNWKGLWRAS